MNFIPEGGSPTILLAGQELHLSPRKLHRGSLSDLSHTLQVVLAFFEKRKTQRWSLIGGKQEERLYWEQWYAPFCTSGSSLHMGGQVLAYTCEASCHCGR